MTFYMLDTNAVSELVADPKGRVACKIAEVGMDNVAISVVVSAEIEFGLEQKLSERLTTRMRRLLGTMQILPLKAPADRHYGVLRAGFKKQGRPIGPNDLFIAAHALAIDATLVTANVGEFSRVPGLKIENWLRDTAVERE
jgi:tRNA(fMet)-specific endonuclease VapC